MLVVIFEPDETYCVEVEDSAEYLHVRRPDGETLRCYIECSVNLSDGYLVYVVRNREVSASEIYEAAKLFGGSIVSQRISCRSDDSGDA